MARSHIALLDIDDNSKFVQFAKKIIFITQNEAFLILHLGRRRLWKDMGL